MAKNKADAQRILKFLAENPDNLKKFTLNPKNIFTELKIAPNDELNGIINEIVADTNKPATPSVSKGTNHFNFHADAGDPNEPHHINIHGNGWYREKGVANSIKVTSKIVSKKDIIKKPTDKF